jgi:hypothetical protein
MSRRYRVDDLLGHLEYTRKEALEARRLAEEAPKLFNALSERGLSGSIVKASPKISEVIKKLDGCPIDSGKWRELLELAGEATVKVLLGLDCGRVRVQPDLVKLEIPQEVLEVLRKLGERDNVRSKLCRLAEDVKKLTDFRNSVSSVLKKLSRIYDRGFVGCYEHLLQRLSECVVAFDIEVLSRKIEDTFKLEVLDDVLEYGAAESNLETLLKRCEVRQELSWNTLRFLTIRLCNAAQGLHKALTGCTCVSSPGDFHREVRRVLEETDRQLEVLSRLAERFPELKPVAERLRGFRASSIPRLSELLEILRGLDALPKPEKLDELLGLLLEHYRNGGVDLGELYPELLKRGLVDTLLDICQRGLLQCRVLLS